MSDEIETEPLYAIVRYRLKPEYIERSRLQSAGLYSELAADGPAWLRQASFELDDNGGVLTLVQLAQILHAADWRPCAMVISSV